MAAKNQRNKSESDNNQYVRRSTLIVSVVAALIFGLYMGTLFTSFGSFATPSADGSSAGNQSSDPSAHIESAIAAAEKNPENAQNWIHLGNLYFDAKQPSESVKAYTRALEIQPNNTDVLTDRGTMYRDLGQFELALQSYVKANQIDPTHQHSLFNAGIILYYDLKRESEGIEKWEQLLRIAPDAKAPNGQPLKDMIDSLKK